MLIIHVASECVHEYTVRKSAKVRMSCSAYSRSFAPWQQILATQQHETAGAHKRRQSQSNSRLQQL